MTKTKTVKKQGWSKCFICTHSYKTEEIDEHMNGVTHHLVLEELYQRSRPHHCIVCGCVWNGLALYRLHVGTAEHKKKIAEMVKKRQSGMHVPLKYTTPPDLITLCKERERLSNESRAKRKQEKLLARKAIQEARASRCANPNTNQKQQQHHLYPHHQQNKENKNSSVSGHLDSELHEHLPSTISAPGSFSREWERHTLHQDVSSSQAGGSRSSVAGYVHTSEGPGPHSTTGSQEQGGAVVQSCGSSSWPSASQLFSEIDFSQDFTSDLLPPVGALLFAQSPTAKAEPSDGKEHRADNHNGALAKETTSSKSKKSQHAKKSRKRSLNQSNGSSSDQSQQEDLPRAPGLVKAHVQHISTILRRIRKSLDEEGLANPQPPSTSTTAEEHNEAPKKLKTTRDEDGHNNDEGGTLDATQSGVGGTGAADPAPASQNRLGLPELLKRDLSRLGAKSGTHHEPNLTAARRVRTISSSQAVAGGEAEKEAAVVGPGLKPTLQKLINSTAAKRKVNWKELYLEYHKKKRFREKGMPRFGIELVSPVVPLPDDLQLEEVRDLPLGEDFQWDSIDFESTGSPACGDDPASEEPVLSAGQVGKTAGQHGSVKIEDGWGHSHLQQDVQSPAESTCQVDEDQHRPERAKPKKERQVDELLAVSLREEELSSSLLNLEGSLTLARTALQEAYVKVQHLLVVREKTANDINALRAKRIEILKVMRGGNSSGNGERPSAEPSPEELGQPSMSSRPPVPPLPPPDPPHKPAQPDPSSAEPEEPTQASVTIKVAPISPESL